MASITTRAGKGAPLTHAEVDANFTGLNSELSLKYDASNPSGFISGNQTISITGDATGSGTTSIPLTLASTGVTAGSYTAPNITIDDKGRVTAISSGTGTSFDQNLNTTDSVTFAGLTVNGRQTIAATGVANAASLKINTSSSATFVHSQENFAANLTAGQHNILAVGKEGSTKNTGYIGYYWAGAGSDSNFVTIGHWGNDDILRVYGGTYTESLGSMRAPIFYDSNDTGYYIDPNSTSRFNYFVPNRIKCVNNVNNEPRWDFSAYVVEAQHWYGNNSSQTMYLGEANYINIRNTADIHGDARAPIFYDRNNTGYYCDPTGTSRLSTINCGDVYNDLGGWFRNYGSTGLYNQSYARGIWVADASGSSYGNFSTYGTGINSWQGWDINNDYTYMGRDNTDHGLHNRNFTWMIYQTNGGLIGLGTSTTSGSYRVYINGALYSTSNIVAHSDVRKKENIVTIPNALDKVKRMRGVFYNKIDDPQKTEMVGVIAQEVNEVLPQAVTYAEDVDEYGVAYGNMVGLLIEAIKEQSKEIEMLKEKVSGLN